MDSDFASKLQNVLSDPEAMAKITAIASSLGAPQQNSEPAPSEPLVSAPPVSEPDLLSALPSAAQGLVPQSDPRLALLASLKPLLREEKRGRVDSLLNALTVASVLKAFRK